MPIRQILSLLEAAPRLSAAMTARNRAKSVIVISNPAEASGLYKAERVDNYPGLPQIKGRISTGLC